VSELPEGWVGTTIGSLARFVRGVSFAKGDAQSGERPGYLPVLRAGNLQDGGILWSDLVFVPERLVSSAQRLTEGDIVVAMSSGSASVVGKAAPVLRADAKRVAGFGAFCGVWRPASAEWSVYLRHYFQSAEYRQAVTAAALGVNINNLRADHIGSLEIGLPPASEQRRIVAKLEDLLARSRRAKTSLDAVPPLLEKLRQSVLAAAFRGDLTADWRAKNQDAEPAEKLLARIRFDRRKKWEAAALAKMKAKGKPPTDDRWKQKYVEPEPADTSGLPELPEGWCWAGLSEVASLQLGQRRAPEYEHQPHRPYVRAANITWRGLDLTDVKTMGFADPDSVALEPGDVLLSEASGSPTEVGKPALWTGELENCCFQATVLRVRSYSASLRGGWLRLAFLKNALLGDFAAMAPGVGILHLTAERMRAWPVPLAPFAEQVEVVQRTEAIMKRWAATEDLVPRLHERRLQLDRSVLAKAFRGELVPRPPTDELADVMLGRLNAESARTVPERATRGSRRTPSQVSAPHGAPDGEV